MVPGTSHSCSHLLSPPNASMVALQHSEFDPVVNARVHQLGTKRGITNKRMNDQFQSLLQAAAYMSQPLTEEVLLQLTYHLVVQDRFDEAEEMFSRLPASGKPSCALQRDYLAAYLDFSSGGEELSVARAVAAKYPDHPVARWNKLFGEIRSQLREIDGDTTTAPEAQTKQTSLELDVENGQVVLQYQVRSGEQGAGGCRASGCRKAGNTLRGGGCCLPLRLVRLVTILCPAPNCKSRSPLLHCEFTLASFAYALCVEPDPAQVRHQLLPHGHRALVFFCPLPSRQQHGHLMRRQAQLPPDGTLGKRGPHPWQMHCLPA